MADNWQTTGTNWQATGRWWCKRIKRHKKGSQNKKYWKVNINNKNSRWPYNGACLHFYGCSGGESWLSLLWTAPFRMSLLLCSYSSGQTAHRGRWIMWWPSEFSSLYMAIVYELSTLQLMLQTLIDHMISRLEVWVYYSAVFLPSFWLPFHFTLSLLSR